MSLKPSFSAVFGDCNIFSISAKERTVGSFRSVILVDRISAGSFSTYSCDERYLKKPFTDDKLAQMLKEKGYNIARRTIAKYREQLSIPVARLRKEL